MIDEEILTREHPELDALAARLLVHVSSMQRATDGLSALRWRLNHVLMVHLAQEDKLVYPILRSSPDASTRNLADRFADQLGGLADAYQAYNNDWTFDRVEADWPGFAKATRSVMSALRRRIQREEAELYPLIARRAA